MGFFTPILGIRAAQLLLSIITIGLGGATIGAFNRGSDGQPPSSLNFLIFCCVWSWLCLAYLLITPRFLPRLHDKFAVLGVEIVANIFWFSGWIALAAFVGNGVTCSGDACGTLKGTIAMGCFSWLSWTASLVLVCLSIFKNTNIAGAMPMMGAQHAPLGAGVDSSYPGPGGYNNSATPMGFNPSETPAPYSASNTPAPYDPHLQPAHLQAQHTGVSEVSDLSSGPYAGGGYGGGHANKYGQDQSASPYDPHYSQHHDYSGAAEMPAATGYGGR